MPPDLIRIAAVVLLAVAGVYGVYKRGPRLPLKGFVPVIGIAVVVAAAVGGLWIESPADRTGHVPGGGACEADGDCIGGDCVQAEGKKICALLCGRDLECPCPAGMSLLKIDRRYVQGGKFQAKKRVAHEYCLPPAEAVEPSN